MSFLLSVKLESMSPLRCMYQSTIKLFNIITSLSPNDTEGNTYNLLKCKSNKFDIISYCETLNILTLVIRHWI